MNNAVLVFAVYDSQGYLVKVDPAAYRDMAGQFELAVRIGGQVIAQRVAPYNYTPNVARAL